MRQRAMERFGQTRKRAGQASEDDGKQQKRRRSGDMMNWLQERTELEKEERKAKRQEEVQHSELDITGRLPSHKRVIHDLKPNFA